MMEPSADLVPIDDVEAEVDVRVLVVVVVEYAARLPRLPPVRFESDSRVVQDRVAVVVRHDSNQRNWRQSV